MKKLNLLALVTLFICGNASAITPESCKKSTAIIQNKMAKLNSYAPFDVNQDGEADHSDIYEWRKLFDFADVNSDGIVTDADAKVIQKAISQKAKYVLKHDVNVDNRVNMDDVFFVQRTIGKMEKKNSPYDINKDGFLSDVDQLILETVIPVIVKYEKSLDTNKDGKISFQDAKN